MKKNDSPTAYLVTVSDTLLGERVHRVLASSAYEARTKIQEKLTSAESITDVRLCFTQLKLFNES